MRIVVIGAGKVALELVRQTATNPAYQYVGISDSSVTVTKYSGFTPDEMMGIVAYKARGGKLRNYEDGRSWVTERPDDILDQRINVVVDASTHQTYGLLMRALDNDINIVGSNKLPYADVSPADFKRLYSKAKKKRKTIDNRTVVSANLGTLRRIEEFAHTAGGVSYIKGCLSGTWGYISWKINQGVPFSQAVYEAKEAGYTETDARIDLRGTDSARKAVIMARTNGVPLGLANIQVEKILSPEIENAGAEDALKLLPTLDETIKGRVAVAIEKNCTLRYVGELDFDKWVFEIGFKEIPLDDPQAFTRGTDNKVTMFPRYWNGKALSIEGPGAGIEVTAQGLMAGLYDLSLNHLMV
ncbi:MAG: hypothetical protein V1836_00630 [Candidatus Aenigmatarchaeota archaeon]